MSSITTTACISVIVSSVPASASLSNMISASVTEFSSSAPQPIPTNKMAAKKSSNKSKRVAKKPSSIDYSAIDMALALPWCSTPESAETTHLRINSVLMLRLENGQNTAKTWHI
ncbi:hypothetical protein MAM1_0200d07850 [Mucor ambiguus]|uniref:Uncharacterized protein n=1 Tax=Mucor ambiguus TaxID=91626 RepID=A0A0C9MCK1_9FUNG|nr:hypothetical protein MAM1_0200d07850 [Mucor ambiguus]